MTAVTESRTPADSAARQRIVGALDETLFVEAGAGSGKTSSLVGRFVALVLGGADVSSIAAITFTEAAAAELRARIREALEEVGAGRSRGGLVVDEVGMARARGALEELDRATISTLHAFAQRLLLSAPIEAGLPPRVEVHDEISSALRTDERWGRFVQQLLDDDSLEVALRAGLALRIGVDHLAAVAATFNQNWDLLVDLDLSGERDLVVDEAAVALSVAPLLDAASEIEALAACCLDDDDKLHRWIIDDMPDKLRPLRSAASDVYSLLEAAREPPKITSYGRAASWPDDTKPRIVALWNDAIATMQDRMATITDLVLRRLSVEVVDHTLAEAQARRRDGRLEFHDLLVLARQVLRDDVSVRRRMHEQFRHLLIDEFQDTDPIQVELAVRIAADPAHDTTLPWDEVDVEPGRLFFVGDPKQSIYRFRRADIDLFVRTADRHPSGATRLDTNFRTVRPIVEFCNQLFGHLITHQRAGDDEDAPVAQPAYAELNAWRGPIPDDPGPPVVLIGTGETEANADSLRRAEASDIVATLVRAKTEGWLVEREGGHTEPCGWGDMAILLPSRTSLPHLRRALGEADVPHRLETGSLVYATTEVRDLLSICRAIDDPGDEIALLGALRSPAYGCGDDDLWRWRKAGRRWSYLHVDHHDTGEGPDTDAPAGSDPEVDDGPVAAAFHDLLARHRSRPFRSVPELVEAVVRERGLMEIALVGGRHRDAWRLYRVVVEHARQFADAEPGGLREFLRWAELQADDKLRATVPVLPEADVDAVRILTVHGAKGLEFGITAVSGLSGQFPRSMRGAVVRFRPEGGFDVRMKQGLETAQFDSRRTVEDVMDEHEGIRLLYVALTRARDHLVVSLHHKPAKKVSTHAQRIAEHVDGGLLLDPGAVERHPGSSSRKADHVQDEVRAIVDVAPVGAAVDPDDAGRWVAEQERWAASRQRLLDTAAGGGAVSATAVSRSIAVGADVAADAERPEPTEEPWRRGRAGTAIGSAVHGVLQHADLTDPTGADLADLARWQARVEGVPDAAPEIEAKARAAVGSPLVRRAVGAGRWWREVHVGAPLAAVAGVIPLGAVDLFEGFVDLLFEDEDGLVVVDYKTDAVPDQGAVDAALDRYAPQGAAYALAVEAATGRPVTEVHFLFLRGRDAVVATVDDLPTQTERVRGALAALGAAGSLP